MHVTPDHNVVTMCQRYTAVIADFHHFRRLQMDENYGSLRVIMLQMCARGSLVVDYEVYREVTQREREIRINLCTAF